MVAAKRTELSFAERFCGPPGSANGGFACGSIAEGRKRPAGSALLDGHGRVLAAARTVWVTIPASVRAS